ncbi:MAG: hypothetical protein IKG46_12400 [Solobacterium sp.]|nr:hypothetical protein [Solobacterium sp.]
MKEKTLIIGLGGSGLRIAEMISDKLSGEDRENCIFMGFDSEDNGQKHRLQKKLPVHTFLENPKDDWFPLVPFPYDDGIDSRVGIRLSLNYSIYWGYLNDLTSILMDEQPQRVILTGSFFGDAGSALIVPLSFYIRNTLKNPVHICGLFLLPEVFDPIFLSEREQEYARAKAYVVMRELHAYTADEAGLLKKKYRIRMALPRYQSRESDICQGRPLDLCFLMDANAEQNASMQETMESAAHFIRDLVHESFPDLEERLGADGVCRFAVINSSRTMTACRKPVQIPLFAKNGPYEQAFYQYKYHVVSSNFDKYKHYHSHNSVDFPDLDES